MAVVAFILGIIGGLLALALGLGIDVANPTAALAAVISILTSPKTLVFGIPAIIVLGAFATAALPMIGGILMLIGASGLVLVFGMNYVTGTAVFCSAIGAILAILSGIRRPSAAPAAG